MAKLAIKKGSTDVSLYVFISDSSVATGAGKTGLVYNSPSLVCYYVRPLASAAALSLVTQTVTGAHSDGGFIEVDATNMPGVYRLDLSDAIVASGVNSVVVMLKGAADMAPLVLEIELVAYDPQDTVRMGLTALPNAAADAAGGLPISDAGGLDIDTLLARLDAAITTRMATYTQPTGFLAATFSGTVANTTNITAGTITTVTNVTNAPTSGDLTATMKTSVQTAAAAAITAYDPPTNAEMELRTIVAANYALEATLTSMKGATFNASTDSLEALRDRGDAAWITATGFSTHSAGDVADAVWLEPLSDHSGTAGSTAEALDSASSAGDPWSTALPGAYGSGTAGKIVGDNLNATVSSRATQASVDSLDGKADAIAQDTAINIPAVLTAMAGSGFLEATDSLEAIRNRGDAAWITGATAAEVNAQVLDVLTVDTFAEPAAVPAATATIEAKLGWLAALARNKVLQTSTTQTLRNDADSANIATSSHSDDGTTHSRGEWT